jgi:hypothetical protein
MAFEEVQIGDCRLILGDCREVLPLLPVHDLLLTDPPYGIGEGQKAASGRYRKQNARWSGCKDTKQYDGGEWDGEAIQDWVLHLMLELATHQINFWRQLLRTASDNLRSGMGQGI